MFNPAEDYNLLLVISIAFGLVHIFYGLSINAYIKLGMESLDALYDVGFWYLALIGAIDFYYLW